MPEEWLALLHGFYPVHVPLAELDGGLGYPFVAKAQRRPMGDRNVGHVIFDHVDIGLLTDKQATSMFHRHACSHTGAELDPKPGGVIRVGGQQWQVAPLNNASLQHWVGERLTFTLQPDPGAAEFYMTGRFQREDEARNAQRAREYTKVTAHVPVRVPEDCALQTILDFIAAGYPDAIDLEQQGIGTFVPAPRTRATPVVMGGRIMAERMESRFPEDANPKYLLYMILETEALYDWALCTHIGIDQRSIPLDTADGLGGQVVLKPGTFSKSHKPGGMQTQGRVHSARMAGQDTGGWRSGGGGTWAAVASGGGPAQAPAPQQQTQREKAQAIKIGQLQASVSRIAQEMKVGFTDQKRGTEEVLVEHKKTRKSTKRAIIVEVHDTVSDIADGVQVVGEQLVGI